MGQYYKAVVLADRLPYGYRELPAHLFAEGGMSERPAQEVVL